MTGITIDPTAVVDGAVAAASGVPNAPLLVSYAEGMVGDDGALAAARAALRAQLGDEALVDAAAVASNFERMVRIADGTGIPLDTPVAALADDLRDSLGLGRFASAARTPRIGIAGRALVTILRPGLNTILRLVGMLRRRRST